MKRLLLLLLCALSLSAQVTLKKPDGTEWTGTLKAHPRLLIDSNNSFLLDPDGSGPQRSVNATMANVDWATLWRLANWAKPEGTTPWEAKLMTLSLIYMMDNHAGWKVQSGEHRSCTDAQLANEANDTERNCIKWTAMDLVDRFQDLQPTMYAAGVCDFTHGACGFGNWPNNFKTDYWGSSNFYIAMFYDVFRPVMNATRRDKFLAMALNGLESPEPGGDSTFAEPRAFYGPRFNGYFEYQNAASSIYSVNTTDGFLGTWHGDEISTTHLNKWMVAHQEITEADIDNSSPITPDSGILVMLPQQGKGNNSTKWCTSISGKSIPSTSSGTGVFLSREITTVNTNGTLTVGGQVIYQNPGDPIVFVAGAAGVLPGGITAGTTYYIKDRVANSFGFHISATPGGPALTFSDEGTQPFYMTVPDRVGKCYGDGPRTSIPLFMFKIVDLGAYNSTTHTQSVRFLGTAFYQNSYRLWVWPLPEWNNSMLGFGQWSKWHGNAPFPTASRQVTHAFGLETSIDATQTTITVSSADADRIASFTPPYFVSMGSLDKYNEIVKVVAVNGANLTVVRGVHNTIARPWPAKAPSTTTDAWIIGGRGGGSGGMEQ